MRPGLGWQALALGLLLGLLAGSGPAGAATYKAVPMGNIAIGNQGRQAVSFLLKCGGTEGWRTMTIASGGNEAVPCLLGPVTIRLGTQGKATLERDLTPGERYVIYWDNGAQRWDIGQLKR